ncbi:GIY-YIG nuclease family protein [Burkholderiaceae bacterium DAT-1]|nr:GIY-YIG nuclease family protein [Burkholderiaceae bacterium DAT-1]
MTLTSISPAGQWAVYILECRDGSLYTGISNDVMRRLDQHNAGIGAKYTKSRLPVHIVWVEASENRREASIREANIKQLSRAEKLRLIASVPQGMPIFAGHPIDITLQN